MSSRCVRRPSCSPGGTGSSATPSARAHLHPLCPCCCATRPCGPFAPPGRDPREVTLLCVGVAIYFTGRWEQQGQLNRLKATWPSKALPPTSPEPSRCCGVPAPADRDRPGSCRQHFARYTLSTAGQSGHPALSSGRNISVPAHASEHDISPAPRPAGFPDHRAE